MIVSILPAAQLSQIELLFAPYTHDKMHFSFFIRYRFSDFFFIWLLLSESVFPPRLTIWELLVRCFGCSTLSCDYLDTTCWWYNLIISHSTHQTPQLWEIQSPCRPSRLFGKRCKHYYHGCADDQGHFPLHVNHWAATSDRKKFLNDSGTCIHTCKINDQVRVLCGWNFSDIILHKSNTCIIGRKIPWYRCIKILFINWAQISPEAKSVWAKYNIYKLPPEISYLVEFTKKGSMISYQISFIPQYGPS